MPFLGNGSYGCIYKPPLRCVGNSSSNNNNKNKTRIGKIFEKYSEYEIEKSLQDKFRKYLLSYEKYCDVPIKKIKDCPLVNNDSDGTKPQLIMPYGGDSLEKIISKRVLSLKECKYILLGFERVMKNVEDLYKQGYIHQDIKPDNILYDKKQKLLHLIDPGIMIKKNRIYHKDNVLLCAKYFYFPPEYKLYDSEISLIKYIDTSVEIISQNIMVNNKLLLFTDELKKRLNMNYERELRNGFKAFKKNKRYGKYISKINSYQLGIVLFYICLGCPRVIKHQGQIDLLKNMIHPNPEKRITLSKAIKEYKRFFMSTAL